jgi:rhamnulokinase
MLIAVKKAGYRISPMKVVRIPFQVFEKHKGLWMIQSVKKEIGSGYSYSEIVDMASKETINSIVDCGDDVFLAPTSMVGAVQEFCKNTDQKIPETLAEIAHVIYNSLAFCYGKTAKKLKN